MTKAKENVVSIVNEIDEEKVHTLPAGYVDENGTTHTDFTLREITGKDEEALSKADMKNNSCKMANLLLARCITRIGSLTPQSVGSFDWATLIKNLLVGDQDFMLMKLRELSKGEELEINHVCPDCKAKLVTTMLLSKCKVTLEAVRGEYNAAELAQQYESPLPEC